MKKLFGTDGVRGVANVFPMTSEMAMQIGRAAAYLFKNGNRRHKTFWIYDRECTCCRYLFDGG
jgi:phosphomannomutase